MYFCLETDKLGLNNSEGDSPPPRFPLLGGQSAVHNSVHKTESAALLTLTELNRFQKRLLSSSSEGRLFLKACIWRFVSHLMRCRPVPSSFNLPSSRLLFGFQSPSQNANEKQQKQEALIGDIIHPLLSAFRHGLRASGASLNPHQTEPQGAFVHCTIVSYYSVSQIYCTVKNPRPLTSCYRFHCLGRRYLGGLTAMPYLIH